MKIRMIAKIIHLTLLVRCNTLFNQMTTTTTTIIIIIIIIILIVIIIKIIIIIIKKIKMIAKIIHLTLLVRCNILFNQKNKQSDDWTPL